MVQERPVRVERRLSAILAADVAGYSRLMHNDEEATHAKLTALLMDAVGPAIAEHGGRIVKNTGDGFLAEFPSAVEAVRAAVKFQTRIKELTIGDAEDRRIAFRVGINIGDVIVEPHDIFGDGVNIAARLESIAEPGGICISSSAYDHVRGKVGATFAALGEQSLKNIALPVRTYAVIHAGLGAQIRNGGAVPTPLSPPRLSFVVLPFANLSADPEQDYFAHGLTDDLTTDLSLWEGSFVVARSTAFAYKSKAVDAKQIGRQLDVRYVVEGSVRRSKNRVRVGVQLTDCELDSQIWAERFDRDLADLFEMQDEITGRIALAIHYKLTDVQRRRAERSNNPDALDLVFRGDAELYKRDSKTTLAEARNFFDAALQIDSSNTRAWAGLSEAHVGDVLHRWSDAPTQQLRAAEGAATKALACNPTSPRAHIARAAVLFAQTRLEAAFDEYAKAIELGGNYPIAYARMGILNAMLGRPEETSQLVERAVRLSPRDNKIGEWYLYNGVARFMTDQLEEAIIWLRRSIEAYPELALNYCVLGSAWSLTGHHEEARAALSEFMQLMPGMTINKLRASPYSNHPAYLAWRERLCEGLRKAGMPEG